MILKKLFIKNMFAYSGEIEIDLEPKNNKNIILIGARNGRGKTSFLRIIRILLHGLKNNSDFTKADVNLIPNEYALGKGNKWEGIFNKTYKNNTASIKGIFEFENNELIITRDFEKTNLSFNENLTVYYNFQKQLMPQEFLNNILPSNFAQFFFFDGEKLENLMNTQNLNVKESLEVLLNIKTYEKLITNIKSIQRNYKKETENTPSIEEISKLEYQRNSLMMDIKIDRNTIKKIEKEIQIFKIDIEEQQDKLTDFLSNKKADIKPLKSEKEVIEKELSTLKEYISSKLKGIDFLVLIAEGLSRKYLSKLEDDKTNYKLDEQLKLFKRTLNVIIAKVENNVFDSTIEEIPPEYNLNFDTTEYYQNRIKMESDKAWEKFKKDKSKNIDKQIIYFHEEDKETLQKIFEEKSLLYEKLIDLKKLEVRLKEIKNKIENATEDASENDNLINTYKIKKEELETQKSNYEQKIGELNKNIELKSKEKDKLDIKIKNLERSLNLSKPILNSIELSNKLIDFFQEFKLKLLHKKIADLENQFNISLFDLAHDKDWIKMVQINDKFEIKLLNFLEREISINSLSAGQRQILATALIQALASVSEVKSFICIDTPLARIDLENREQIITKYYPKASKQVIILSTNSEIDPSKREYRLMKDFISKEYTIVSDEYSSSFETGYFNEIERG
jgi:DNA sulfur modification protein DndD